MSIGVAPVRKGSVRRKLIYALLIVFALVLIAGTTSFLINRNAPRRSQVVDVLSPHQKTLIAESLRLKNAVGDQVWPGFGSSDIPLVIYNEERSFWVGDSAAPAGWEPVPSDYLLGNRYYRGRVRKNEAFAVKYGDCWAGSMATKEWFQIGFAHQLRDELPGPLRSVFPYPLVLRAMGLRSSDQYISVVLHESFHAYEARTAPARFQAAQKTYAAEREYPWDDAEVRRAWGLELELLARAINVQSDREAEDLARQFIQVRQKRHSSPAMSQASIAYERQVEWLEGLGKYAELKVWREGAAARQRGYKPVPEIASDPEFRDYGTFWRRWSGELSTLKSQASRRGDIRFYYSGMAQAFLLDRLARDWKTRISLDDLYVDDLLAQVLQIRDQGMSNGQRQ